MCYLINNGNILHLKEVFLGKNKWAENYIGNNIAYDVKSFQVKMTKVNFTEVQFKGLKISTNHRIDVGISDMYVTRL